MTVTPLNNAFPQRAVIMGINDDKTAAQVLVPLAQYETGFIDACIPLDSSLIGREVIVLFINGDRNQGVIVDLVAPANHAYPQEATINTITGQQAEAQITAWGVTATLDSTVTLDAVNDVGKTAIVVFINGDPQQGIIVGVKS